ncbi:hypothetical protein HBP99_16115 [Listeria booriae]|uniref:hypothetical protein n=1 Tax=Listeria booriae TaxID=1552123 RepID=UPI00162490BB|nr:hypothetical protein [Listeria booriae]MBC2370156.1 hypothetical protein [Listeria booriae]
MTKTAKKVENKEKEPLLDVENQDVIEAPKVEQSVKDKKAEKIYKIVTPNPKMYVAIDERNGIWSDEKGIMRTKSEKIKEYLLTFSEFKDVTDI